MAIGVGSLLEVVMNMNVQGQQTLNVFQYEVATYTATPTAVAIAEAWWNNIKTSYRAMAFGAFGNVFRTVKLRELNNPSGAYAEYDVPVGEQIGNRTTTPTTEAMPSFCAAGARLVVGTRATRPGQKRVPFLWEGDSGFNSLQPAFSALFGTWLGVVTSQFALGAPAALTSLTPIICRKNVSGDVVAHQVITGFLINGQITTQNTRKNGRGA